MVRWRSLRWLCTIVLVLVAGCGAPAFEPPARSGDRMVANGLVVDVVDGDTIEVELASGRELVRLLGVDTPETVDPNRPAQCFGAEASAFLAEQLPPGTGVLVVRDRQSRDRFGRLLAYVHRASDGLFANYALLAEGYAETLSIEPNSTYKALFRAARNDAVNHGRGLWSACDGPDQPIADS